MLLVEEDLLRSARVFSGLREVGVIIPTCNAERHWPEFKAALDQQGLEPSQILVIDSASTDRTLDLARAAGYGVVSIARCEFNHGGTRRLACEHLPDARVLVFLTQDAIPSEATAIKLLCEALNNPMVGAAYGRQLARVGADPIERHARLFNYPPCSELRTLAARDTLGIKAAFLSNSFAAYRRSALQAVGGFPADVILAEDSFVAARLLVAGWRIAYVAEARVVHSHNLSIGTEFSRYFDTGVHHARQNWILSQFGGAGGEGRRFVLSELRYLGETAWGALPRAMLRTALKWLAYQLGRREQYLPLPLKRRLSSSANFWKS